jgi:hypothetical protein
MKRHIQFTMFLIAGLLLAYPQISTAHLAPDLGRFMQRDPLRDRLTLVDLNFDTALNAVRAAAGESPASHALMTTSSIPGDMQRSSLHWYLFDRVWRQHLLTPTVQASVLGDNAYAVCAGNPVGRVDATGLTPYFHGMACCPRAWPVQVWACTVYGNTPSNVPFYGSELMGAAFAACAADAIGDFYFSCMTGNNAGARAACSALDACYAVLW